MVLSSSRPAGAIPIDINMIRVLALLWQIVIGFNGNLLMFGKHSSFLKAFNSATVILAIFMTTIQLYVSHTVYV